jgi:hypothetical protein
MKTAPKITAWLLLLASIVWAVESRAGDDYDFPNQSEIRTIGQIADGLYKWKSKAGGWYDCGIHTTDSYDLKDKSIKYAMLIVEVSRTYNVDPWGLVGVFANESRFDSCALGYYPRKKAYSLGILKKKKRSISHTREEILAVLNHPKMKKLFRRTGVDIGLGQLLSRFYRNRDDYENMLSPRGSATEAAWWALGINRGRHTKRFWRWWRGSETDWYDKKIVKWIKKIKGSR